MYTYAGDANLDGQINIDDYGHIDTSVGIGLTGWINGDFNYDGVINIDDYGIIDVNVGVQGAPFSTELAATAPVARPEGVTAAVPEPAAFSSVVLLSLATFRRGGRRHK